MPLPIYPPIRGWHPTLSRSIPALTQKPEIYVPEILQPWHQVTLFCAFNWIFDECPVPTLSWIGNTVSPHDASSRTSYFSELTFTPRPQDHNTELTCQVDCSGEGVSTENTVRLSGACESGGGKDCALQARRMGRWREGLGEIGRASCRERV